MNGSPLCDSSHPYTSLMFVIPLGAAQLCSLDEGHIVLEVQCSARWTFGAKTAIPMYSFKFH